MYSLTKAKKMKWKDYPTKTLYAYKGILYRQEKFVNRYGTNSLSQFEIEKCKLEEEQTF